MKTYKLKKGQDSIIKTVGLVYYHWIINLGITSYINDHKIYNILFSTNNKSVLLHQLENNMELPDILLVNLTVETDALDLLEWLNIHFPSLRIIGLAIEGNSENKYIAYEYGCVGYVEITSQSDLLALALDDVAQFGYTKNYLSYLESKKNDQIVLKGREAEYLNYASLGMKISDIANAMNLSEKSVEKYNAHVFKKFDAENRNELIKKATELGFIKVGKH